MLCCLRRKLLWPEVQSVPATQRNSEACMGHLEHQEQPHQKCIHVIYDTPSLADESSMPEAHSRTSRLQVSFSCPKQSRNRPEARSISAPLRALG